MRIENITARRLKGAEDSELRHLRSRFINIFDRYFAGSDVQKAVDIERRVFLTKYIILYSEMRNRGMKVYRKAPIDEEAYSRIIKSSLWSLDVPALGDLVVVPDYVSVGGSFVKSPKEAEDIDVIIRDSGKAHDESFELKVGRLLGGQTGKEPHFVYAPKGPHNSYIPVFDLVLRARDDTKKVRVKESVVAKELTPSQRKECDEETGRIKENREKAMWPHKFKPAKYTHPNGHPRCLICGDEEEVGGVCHKSEDPEKGEREYFEGLDNWDKDMKNDNAEVIKSLAEGSVLDLGCGTCKLLTILRDTGREVLGVDRSGIALGFCKKREIETKKLDLEGGKLPFDDNSFDNVTSVHALEHLESPEKLIKEARRIARKRVVILSPLGERMDPTHKQEFKEFEDFKKCFGDEWKAKKVEESNSAISVFNIEEEKEKFRVEKPEETENTIRIPGEGGDCAVTATITISEEKGIKAVYCGGVKKVRTYIFDKAKGWTMTTAKAWVKEHGKKTVAKIGESATFRIIKIDKKRQIVGGIVYEPHEVDTQGDYTDAGEIEKAMYRFMEKYATNTKRIRINHKGKKYFFPILECFQPEHDTVKGDERVKAGSWWLMIKITNNEIWKHVEEGTLGGFSMGGRAKT